MPKRMNANRRRKLLEAIIHRDGDACLLCRTAPVRDKTIDHLDGKTRNNRLENLHLLCRACNTAEGNRARMGRRWLTAETLPGYRAHLPKAPVGCSLVPLGEGGGERAGRVPSFSPRAYGRAPKQDVEASSGLMDAYFRLWLFRHLGGAGEVTESEAVNSGAEFLDRQVGRGNPKTTARYFLKAISGEGWLKERRTPSGQSVWVFRPNVDLGLLQEELERRVVENGGTVEFKKSWLKLDEEGQAQGL